MKRWPRQKTSYSMHRTDTGRLSSGMDRSDPDKGLRARVHQVQNIPRKLRDSFVADPGHRLIGADYAGIEWAIAIWFCSKENTPPGFHMELLERFRAGQFDPHRYLASYAFGVPEAKVTPEQRKICKAYTHGRMFDGSPIGLAREVGHTQATGHRVCEAHVTAFKPEVWKRRTIEKVTSQRYVQTPLGWRRYFWGYKPKSTEALATLVQGTAGDLCKQTLKTYYEEAPPWLELLTTTHDSLLAQAPEPQVQEGAAFIKDVMERPVPWLGGLSWRADVSIGDNWKEVS